MPGRLRGRGSACLIVAWVAAALGVAGCVDIPSPGATDAVPAVDPGADGRPDVPPTDAGPQPTDAVPPLPDRGPLIADRGPASGDGAVDAEAPPPDAGSPFACPVGARADDLLGVCLRIERCDLPAPRVGHRLAVLESGRVLLAGGGTEPTPGAGLSRTVWLYDGAGWREVDGLAEGRHRHSLTAVPGDRAYLVGGDRSAGEPIDDPQSEAYVFEAPESPDGAGDWREDGGHSDRRARHAAGWFDGSLVVSGGIGEDSYADDGSFAREEIWRDGDGWEDGEQPPLLFDQHIESTGGATLMFGGQTFDPQDEDVPTRNRMVYLRQGVRWAPLATELTHLGAPAPSTPDGVLLVGGDVEAVGRVRRLTADGIEPLGMLAVERSGHGAARLGHESLVVVLGGEAGGGSGSTIEIFDVASGRRGALALVGEALGDWRAMQTVTLADGQALFAGGLLAGRATDRCLRVSLVPAER